MATLNKINGEWVVTAGGQRMWVGTQSAYETARANNEISANSLVAITDDGNDNEYMRYSFDEKKCGFWIDGKPIYKKTFVQNFDITTVSGYVAGEQFQTSFIIATMPEVDKFIKLEGIVFRSKWMNSIPYYDENASGRNTVNLITRTKEHDVSPNEVRYTINTIGDFLTGTIYVTVYYTKQTT